MRPSLSRQQIPPQQPALIDRPRCLTRSCFWATGHALMTIAFVASCTTDRAGDKNSSRHELSRASGRGSMSLPFLFYTSDAAAEYSCVDLEGRIFV